MSAFFDTTEREMKAGCVRDFDLLAGQPIGIGRGSAAARVNFNFFGAYLGFAALHPGSMLSSAPRTGYHDFETCAVLPA